MNMIWLLWAEAGLTFYPIEQGIERDAGRGEYRGGRDINMSFVGIPFGKGKLEREGNVVVVGMDELVATRRIRLEEKAAEKAGGRRVTKYRSIHLFRRL